MASSKIWQNLDGGGADHVNNSDTPAPPLRRKHVRSSTWSRSGCITCKRRRKKCDLSRPTCSNCFHRGVACEGYASPFTFQEIRLDRLDRPRTSGIGASGATTSSKADTARLHDAGVSGNWYDLAALPRSSAAAEARSRPSQDPQSTTDINRADDDRPRMEEELNSLQNHQNVAPGLGTAVPARAETHSDEQGLPTPWPDDGSSATSFGSPKSFDYDELNSTTTSRCNNGLPAGLSPFSYLRTVAFQHLQYFHEKSAAELLNFDAGPSNPLRKLIIPSALESSLVLSAVCAVAACHQGQHENPISNVAASFYFKAVGDLRTILGDAGTSAVPFHMTDEHLYAATLLCKYEIISGGIAGNWKAHLRGLYMLLKSHGDVDSECARYVAGFLRYHSIVSDICQVAQPTLMDDSGPKSPLPALMNYSRAPLDAYSGYAQRILSVCHAAASLVRSVEAAGEVSDKDIYNEVSQMISSLGTPDLPFEDDVDLTGTSIQTVSRLFFVAQRIRFATFVFLHSILAHLRYSELITEDCWQTALRRIPYTKGRARDACLDMLGEIPIGKHCEFAALTMPLLLTGCEVDDQSQRKLILERLSLLETSFGLGNIARTRDALSLVWQRRREEGRQTQQNESRNAEKSGCRGWWQILEESGWSLIAS